MIKTVFNCGLKLLIFFYPIMILQDRPFGLTQITVTLHISCVSCRSTRFAVVLKIPRTDHHTSLVQKLYVDLRKTPAISKKRLIFHGFSNKLNWIFLNIACLSHSYRILKFQTSDYYLERVEISKANL